MNIVQGRATRVAGAGRVAFAVTMIGLGVLGLARGDFPPIWNGAPAGLPAREALAYFCALVSLLSGLGLLWRRTAAASSGVLLACLLAWLVAFRVPLIVAAPTSSGMWWACGETALMVAAAWILYAGLSVDEEGQRRGFATGEASIRIARVLYGLALLPFGVAHFTFLERTVSLVPAWLPWHLAWATLTGCAFIAAGVAVVAGVWARLAAGLSALQMLLFTLLVWVPILAAGAGAADWNEAIDSWVLTAGAWVVADSYRGIPWLVARQR
ncbi:MAG TPA: hypothetical protein VMT19_13190 [Thermoanaerobaculaceae bacterium]|nr:hypothetical protein [Thermoanaerobaculaceae bacterium]